MEPRDGLGFRSLDLAMLDLTFSITLVLVCEFSVDGHDVRISLASSSKGAIPDERVRSPRA